LNRILSRRILARDIHEFIVEAPEIAAKAAAGHFVVAMADAVGERIPLTIADFDAGKGTLTLVVMAVGTSSRKIAALPEGSSFHALAGPLGTPSGIRNEGTVVCVAGGVGTAPVFPIARALKAAGNRVVTVQGARSRDLVFWADRLASISDRHLLVTDDGSAGRKALVTEPLREILSSRFEGEVRRVWAIGPPLMMRACAEATRPFGVPTLVSLNTLMVDGTGMCGGCRVEAGGKTYFTCVHGPEFDGHALDWDAFLNRQAVYHEMEKCSLDRYVREARSR
jgi:ferredoxin--NADP+ reductase